MILYHYMSRKLSTHDFPHAICHWQPPLARYAARSPEPRSPPQPALEPAQRPSAWDVRLLHIRPNSGKNGSNNAVMLTLSTLGDAGLELTGQGPHLLLDYGATAWPLGSYNAPVVFIAERLPEARLKQLVHCALQYHSEFMAFFLVVHERWGPSSSWPVVGVQEPFNGIGMAGSGVLRLLVLSPNVALFDQVETWLSSGVPVRFVPLPDMHVSVQLKHMNTTHSSSKLPLQDHFQLGEHGLVVETAAIPPDESGNFLDPYATSLVCSGLPGYHRPYLLLHTTQFEAAQEHRSLVDELRGSDGLAFLDNMMDDSSSQP